MAQLSTWDIVTRRRWLVSAANRENGWVNWSGLATFVAAIEGPIRTAVDRLLTELGWSKSETH
jgi:hypothetical protein